MPDEQSRLQRLTDEAVAAEVVAGRFPMGDDLREVELRTEAAVILADLAAWDPETVYVVGCTRTLAPEGGPGEFAVCAREERTLARPTERVALVSAAGVRREEALVRLDHIRAHIARLPYGTILSADTGWLHRDADPAARLEIARALVLRDIEEGRPFPF
jgi:hypothetical protein